VYFVASGVLGDGAEHGARKGNCELHGQPAEQTCNLYVEHYESASRGWAAPRFIATLSGADAPSWGSLRNSQRLTEMAARVSPDGGHLAFMSERSLTGYDNRDATSGAP